MRDPRALISTSELATLLGDPSLRVYDCTTKTVPPPLGSDVPYVAVPGLPEFETAHIPGADFLDIQGEFSDQSTKLRFMMPPIPQLEAAFGWHGLRPGTRAVLYSSGTMWMSTRFWWMLHSLGCDAAVLDGGFEKWRAEGRLTESGKPKGYPPATLVDPAGQGFTMLADAQAKFAAKGVTPDKHVIAYCGGGISATIDLFMLHQLSYDDITLYDASMGEWARNESVPIETG